MLFIGLTGERGVGKSKAIDYIVSKHGCKRSHAFNVGKQMTFTMLEYAGVPADIAHRMVHGDLRDQPSEYLPSNASCRFFMEKLGKFMGVQLGPEWTLGMELKHLQPTIEYIKTYGTSMKPPMQGISFDSIVYESPLFKESGGVIIRITRKNADKTIEAPETSEAQAMVEHDYVIANDGSLEELYSNLDAIIETLKGTWCSPS